jgi:diguanylate cyclase (GGDEF)-like protein
MHQAGAPNKISVTVSIGVVSTEKGSLIDAVGAADKALYQAKKEGRNEVVVVVKDDVSI